MNAHNPKTEELYHIAGDPYDPPKNGIASEMAFGKGAKGHPQIRYKDYVITADVYHLGDEAQVILICPRCRNQIRVTSERKQIEYNEETNELSIEPFMCTWELNPQDRRMEFGLGLCRWTVGIVKNVARDA